MKKDDKKPRYQGWWYLLFIPGVYSMNRRNGDIFAAIIIAIIVVGIFMTLSYINYERKLIKYKEEKNKQQDKQ